MENLELVLQNNNEIKKVEFNYEELKNNLLSIVENYTGVVYTEDSLKLAKEDRAMLNKVAKALNDKRIEIEKDYMKPFTDFKDKVSELVTIAKNTSNEIDLQVKNFEEKQKEERKQNVINIINSCENEYNCPLNLLFDEKYLLASATEKSINENLTQKFSKIKEDLQIVKDMNPADFEDIKNYYFRSGCDLSATLNELRRINEIAKRIEEKTMEKVEVQQVIQQQVFKQEDTKEEVQEFNLTVFCTKTQFNSIKQFLKNNGIRSL